MPWLELMDELKEIVCDEKWNTAKDVAFLQDALYAQIGAQVVDEFVPAVDPKATTPKASSPPKRRGRGGLPR